MLSQWRQSDSLAAGHPNNDDNNLHALYYVASGLNYKDNNNGPSSEPVGTSDVRCAVGNDASRLTS